MEEGKPVTEDVKSGDVEKPRENAKEVLSRIKAKLDKAEGQRFGGAAERLPKAKMLDARAIEKADPEHKYRYVNTDDPGKVQNRLDEGYTRISEEDARNAGVRRQVGEGVLMKIPRAKHEERVEEIKELGRRRLTAHKAEVRKVAEAVARELRDKHGITVPIDRLMVDE